MAEAAEESIYCCNFQKKLGAELTKQLIRLSFISSEDLRH